VVVGTVAGMAEGQGCLHSSRGLKIARRTGVFPTGRIEASTFGTDRSMRCRYDVGS
jgi:hypothetical protein